jgi:hypothetical protein
VQRQCWFLNQFLVGTSPLTRAKEERKEKFKQRGCYCVGAYLQAGRRICFVICTGYQIGEHQSAGWHGGANSSILPALNVKTARLWRGIVPFTHLTREGRMTVAVGRRELLAALGSAAVVWPLAARAQQGVSCTEFTDHMP